MLTSLTVRGFKTLRDLTLRLSPVTVLLGANNVGKTNVVRAIELLAHAVRLGSLPRAVAEAGEDVRTRGDGGGRLFFKVEGQLDGRRFSYEVSDSTEEVRILEPDGFEAKRGSDGKFHLGAAGLLSSGDNRDPGAGLAALAGSPKPAPELEKDVAFMKRIASFLGGMRAADFSPARLREPSLPSPEVTLGREGENLAAVLDRLQGERPLVRRRIDEEVRKAIPSVDLVTTVAQAQGHKVVGVAEGDLVFNSADLSDGILLFIALSTVTQMSGGSTLVALEEVERGIHPRRIRDTLDQVLRVSRTGSQFLLTTHSPLLLNEFRELPEAVIVLERSGDGTSARQLSELPDLEAALKDVSLGDLWYSGVLGGVPAA